MIKSDYYRVMENTTRAGSFPLNYARDYIFNPKRLYTILILESLTTIKLK